MVLQIERTAPAPTAEDEAAIFQVVASMGWDGYVGDVKNAFGQSEPSNRKTPIACRQPPEGIPGMKPGELLQCVTECYGLVSGPAWWRASLVGWLESVGYHRHPLAPCLMILPCLEDDKSRDKMTDGCMSIRTDDMLEGGEPRHRALIDKMRKRFDFGKYKRLLDDASGTMLNGRRVMQLEDKSFRTHMKEYAKTLKPIKIGRKLKSSDGKPVSLVPGELTVCRGVNGGVQWLASNGRPELAAAASIIPRGFTEPDASLIADLNHVVKTAQDIEYEIKIWPIPVKDRRYIAFFDASFDSAGKRNQLGRIIGCCTPKTNNGEKDLFSMVFGKVSDLTRATWPRLPISPRRRQRSRRWRI